MQHPPPDLAAWRAAMTKPAGPLGGLARKAQVRINQIIPEKVHAAITTAMEGLTRGILTGADFATGSPQHGLTLDEKRAKAAAAIDGWKKTASVEGGITGAGGFLAAAADFPLLMSFKIKLLFEIAAIFGHDGTDLDERLYILHIFELAFSDAGHRARVLAAMDDWDARRPERWGAERPDTLEAFDWRAFQQQYRDHIDLAKLAQLLPVVGAPVGAIVNWRLVEWLGVTAVMAYRMREAGASTGPTTGIASAPSPDGDGDK
ncbi:EcsC family protein [Caulobacter sp. ErkDOM-YI]|uniref:EcsC family protein n=1 Tax=unclassified Caulobacter TaxID=2648921 RepID=UPI003AF5C4C8